MNFELIKLKDLELPAKYTLLDYEGFQTVSRFYDNIQNGVRLTENVSEIMIYMYKLGFLRGYKFLEENGNEPYFDENTEKTIDYMTEIEKLIGVKINE